MIRIYGAGLKEKTIVRKVEKAVLFELDQADFFVVDLSVTDERNIKDYNRETRGVDSVTDVLSFPCFDGLNPPLEECGFAECDYDGGRVYLGSIMICRSRAVAQAEEFGHSYAREIGFLTCHGLLHLFGFDHIDKEDEKKMLALQKRIMSSARLAR